MKKIITVLASVLFVCVFLGSALATPFQNGNFETGDFTGWSGDLALTGPVDPDSDSHFTILPNAGPDNSYVAQVQNDDDDWTANLYQDFTLDTLTPGWIMEISFWVKWEPTDPDDDTCTIQIYDPNGGSKVFLDSYSDTALLMAGTLVTQDITDFAQTWGGQNVLLDFGITNALNSDPDTLFIDNISFEQHAPAPVPEPASALLLLSGLAGLGIVRKKGVI